MFGLWQQGMIIGMMMIMMMIMMLVIVMILMIMTMIMMLCKRCYAMIKCICWQLL